MQVRCWEVQPSGTVIPKAQQTHTGPVLDVSWSDVSSQHCRQMSVCQMLINNSLKCTDKISANVYVLLQ